MNPQFTITEALVESYGPQPWLVVRYDWLEQVEAQFKAIADLPDGWDGDGAPRPETRILDAAWGLLTSLCRAPGVPKPHVNPTRSGGVQLEWENSPRYFEIDVVAERAATYLYRDDDSNTEFTGELFERESVDDLIQYIKQVATIANNPSREATSPLGQESSNTVA